MARKKKNLKAKIISNRKIAPDHYVMELNVPWLGAHSSPGQFVTVRVHNEGTDPLLRIPLGVHAMRKGGIKLLYKVVGPATRILMSRKRGEIVDITGPLGNGYDLAPVLKKKNSRAILVAGGHGVAPLYAVAEALKGKVKTLNVFIGACEAKHVVCASKFRKLKAKVKKVAEKGRCEHSGFVTDPLKEHLERKQQYAEDTTIFACGPRPMLGAVAGAAEEYGVRAQVSMDAYMACGIGACLGCAIETLDGYKLVCKDGPVFDAREIKWKKIC